MKAYFQAIRTLGFDGKPYEELTSEDLIELAAKLSQGKFANAFSRLTF